MIIEVPVNVAAKIREIASVQGRLPQAILEDVLLTWLESQPPATTSITNGHTPAADQHSNGHVPASDDEFPLRGTVLFYDGSDEPAIPEDDWDMLK